MGIGQPVKPLYQVLQPFVDRGQGHYHDQEEDDIRCYLYCCPGRFFSTKDGYNYNFEEDKAQDTPCNRGDEPTGHNLSHFMPVDCTQAGNRNTETGNRSDD